MSFLEVEEEMGYEDRWKPGRPGSKAKSASCEENVFFILISPRTAR